MKCVSVICSSETVVTNLIQCSGVKECTDVAVAAIKKYITSSVYDCTVEDVE